MREPSAPQKMFVYGTLMKGFYHYEKALVGQEVSLVPARTRGLVWHMSNRGYPAIKAGDGWVYGELVELKVLRLSLISWMISRVIMARKIPATNMPVSFLRWKIWKPAISKNHMCTIMSQTIWERRKIRWWRWRMAAGELLWRKITNRQIIK